MRARVVALVVGLVLVAACGSSATEHDLARAETLIASGQWTNARSALGLVVKAQPRHDKARALLLYCLDQEGTLKDITGSSLYWLYQLTQLPTRLDWDRVGKSLRESIDVELVGARKALFDKAIDTADTADLARVLRAAAAFGVTHEKDVDRKARALAIAAQAGDAAAVRELVQRLKGQDVKLVVELLTDTGEAALPALRDAIADRAFLGRGAALQAIAQIVASRRAAELIAERPALTTLEGAALVVPSVLSIVAHPSAHRMHAQYAILGEDVVVLNQAWDDTRDAAFIDLTVLRADQLVPLTILDEHGKRIEVTGTTPMILSTAAERLVLARKVTTRDQVEVDAGALRRPTPGMRVRLAEAHAASGALVRDDGGLWVVKLDAPIDGMAEVTVAADALKRLVTTTQTRTVKQRMHGSVDGSSLVITKIDSEDWKETY